MRRQTIRILIAGMAALLLTPALAIGAERTSAAADRSALALTIYGNGLSLVKDRRPVELPLGISGLDVTGVSPKMLPDSVQLGLGKDSRVLTQTLRPANLNPRRLLEAHLGQTLKLIRRHPQTGAETLVDATLIAVNGGVIARIGGRLISNPEGHWAFPSIPSHLRGEAVLAVAVETAAAGPRPMTMRYLTGGLTWRAAYTVNWDRAAGTLRLHAWAALHNATGIDFDNADVKVVAGQVRRVSAAPRGQLQKAMMMGAQDAAESARAPIREALSGYHLYSLPQPVNLKRGEQVQAALLAPLSVAATRELVSDGHPAVFGRVRGGGGGRPAHPEIRLNFTNQMDDRGQPLPAGAVRLYGKDSAGGAQFLGEDRLGDTPVGGAVTLSAGNAFDVTVKRRQTDFRRLDRHNHEAAFSVELHNGSTTSETVKVVETVPGDWRLMESDKPHTRENNQAVWRITVPAKQSVAFSYRVHVRN